MPKSQSHEFAHEFARGLKAGTAGALKSAYKDVKRIADGADSLPGTAGVLATTAPALFLFPLYFLARGVVAHMADAIEAINEPVSQDTPAREDEVGFSPTPAAT